MTPSAISQILEQIGRVVVGVGLAVFLLPKGIEYSAGGAAFGATAGAVLGGSYLYAKYKKVRKQYGIKKVKTNPRNVKYNFKDSNSNIIRDNCWKYYEFN